MRSRIAQDHEGLGAQPPPAIANLATYSSQPLSQYFRPPSPSSSRQGSSGPPSPALLGAEWRSPLLGPPAFLQKEQHDEYPNNNNHVEDKEDDDEDYLDDDGMQSLISAFRHGVFYSSPRSTRSSPRKHLRPTPTSLPVTQKKNPLGSSEFFLEGSSMLSVTAKSGSGYCNSLCYSEDDTGVATTPSAAGTEEENSASSGGGLLCDSDISWRSEYSRGEAFQWTEENEKQQAATYTTMKMNGCFGRSGVGAAGFAESPISLSPIATPAKDKSETPQQVTQQSRLLPSEQHVDSAVPSLTEAGGPSMTTPPKVGRAAYAAASGHELRGMRHAEAAISGAFAGCEDEADVFISAERRNLFDWLLKIRLVCYMVPGGKLPLHMVDVVERIRKGCEKRESKGKWVLTKFQQLAEGAGGGGICRPSEEDKEGSANEAVQIYLTEASALLKFAARSPPQSFAVLEPGGTNDCGQHPVLLGVSAEPPALNVELRVNIEYEITLDDLE